MARVGDLPIADIAVENAEPALQLKRHCSPVIEKRLQVTRYYLRVTERC